MHADTMDSTDYYATFVEGQTVRLATGGPRCTVIEVCDCCGISIAYGTSDGDIDVLTVPPEAIVHSD